jgi:hypothetical protein
MMHQFPVPLPQQQHNLIDRKSKMITRGKFAPDEDDLLCRLVG